MSAVALYCSAVVVLQLVSVSAVSAVIIEGKNLICIINRKYLSPITLEEGVCHHSCQGEGIAVVESTSLACSLIAVCSQLGHFTFVKITEGRPLYSPIMGSPVYSLIIPCWQ